MTLPDYHGASIVNLVSSVTAALGGEPTPYPPLRGIDPASLCGAGNLVLLVVDGLGYRYLTEAGAGGPLLHHLRARMTSVFPSTTASAITAFMTGLAPQQHALTGWHTYFKELGGVMSVLPFCPRYGGPSLREAGIAPADVFDSASLFDAIPLPCYVVSPERIVHSAFNVAHSGKATRVGYAPGRLFHTIAGIVSGSAERKYVYAYYPEIDGLAHEHGLASHEVADHFQELDAAFGHFLHAIRGSATTVIVTADHGLIDSDPEQLIELARHPQLAQTLLLPLCGERRAAYCYVHPTKREQFEHYVQTVLADFTTLCDSRQLIDDGWFGLGAPHPRLGERVGHYALLMKRNYAIKDWILGERRHVQIGMHGGTSEDEMYVPLVVAQA